MKKIVLVMMAVFTASTVFAQFDLSTMTDAQKMALDAEAGRPVSKYNPAHVKLGLGGADPVSVYLESGVVQGLDSITELHRGVFYQFASEENKQIFLENPNKYEPTYGGWCAWAMAQGSKVPIDTAYFSFDYNENSEQLRVNYYIAAAALGNFHGLGRRDRRTSLAISQAVETEIANPERAQPLFSASERFQATADANWKAISGEEPAFSNEVE